MEQVAAMADVDNLAVTGAVKAPWWRWPRMRMPSKSLVWCGWRAIPAKPDAPEAEAAVVVLDEYHGLGVGQELMRRMVQLARRMRVQEYRRHLPA